jgi:hypothetical protein
LGNAKGSGSDRVIELGVAMESGVRSRTATTTAVARSSGKENNSEDNSKDNSDDAARRASVEVKVKRSGHQDAISIILATCQADSEKEPMLPTTHERHGLHQPNILGLWRWMC